MGRRMVAVLGGGMALAIAMPGAAQSPDQACASAAVSLPPELAGWPARHALQAARSAGLLDAARLQVGQATNARLLAASDVRYPVQPAKPGGPGSYGGLFGFTVRQGGTYRVALGSAAWVDVIRQGKAVASSAHGHGPECSGIHKMVDFRLTPGRYTLQVAAGGEIDLPLLVTRMP